jgi:hypothetical protein
MTVWLAEEPLIWIICWAWELDFKRRRTLWAAVWLYTQDEIYRPIAGHVLDFWEKRISCHSQESKLHIAAISCLTSIKSKDRNHLISVKNKFCVCSSKVRPTAKYLCSKNKHKFHIKDVNFILNFCLKNSTVLDNQN